MGCKSVPVETKVRKWDWAEARVGPQGRPDRASAHLAGNAGARVTTEGSISVSPSQVRGELL